MLTEKISKNGSWAAQQRPLMTTSLPQTHGHKCDLNHRQQRRSLAGLLFDEAGPEKRSPDGRGESEHKRVVQRQQGHREQVVADRAETEYAANQQQAPPAQHSTQLLEQHSCPARRRPEPSVSGPPCSHSFPEVTRRRLPRSEMPHSQATTT